MTPKFKPGERVNVVGEPEWQGATFVREGFDADGHLARLRRADGTEKLFDVNAIEKVKP